MKQLVTYFSDGTLATIVETRDITYRPDPTLLVEDITNHPLKEKIIANPQFFKKVGKDLVEASDNEKAQILIARKHPNDFDILADLERRVSLLETKLK